jgi:hypothetical protein
MRRLLNALMLATFTASFCFGQVTFIGTPIGTPASPTTPASAASIQTGFAVITPFQGSQGLSVSEVLSEEVDGNTFQTVVLPSPLVTLTDLFVTADPNSGVNTGISIVNANNVEATVTFTLRNQQGVTIAITTITIGPLQQISSFVTELFPTILDLPGPITGLVFINSSVTVGVLGLAFQGPSFSALPIAEQLPSNNVINSGTGTTTVAVSTGVIIGQPATFSTTVTTSPIPPPFATGIPSTAVPSTTVPSTAISIPLPGTIIPLPPVTGVIAPMQPLLGVPTPIVNSTPVSTVSLAGGAPVPAPVIVTGIAGAAAVLFPQIATGGGWTSEIVIANASTAPQFVRVDFFNSSGGPLILPLGSTLPNVFVPPGGFVTLSTSTP